MPVFLGISRGWLCPACQEGVSLKLADLRWRRASSGLLFQSSHQPPPQCQPHDQSNTEVAGTWPGGQESACQGPGRCSQGKPGDRKDTCAGTAPGLGRKYISLAPVMGWIRCQVRALLPTEFSRSERGSCHPRFMDKFPAPCPRLVKMGMGW